MKKLFFLFPLLLFLMLAPSSLAWFTYSHAYCTLEALQTSTSPIANLCHDRISKVIDGNIVADIMVIHYYDNKQFSYIATHTRGSGYEKCLSEAGSDPDLKCFCLGLGLHITQDAYSHGAKDIPGFTPKYISSTFTDNFFGHMSVEREFEKLHIALIASTKGSETINNIAYYTGADDKSIACNNLFAETGGNEKYLKILNSMSGLDAYSDANIFCNGYKGTGFYDTVYGHPSSFPAGLYYISIVMLIIGSLLLWYSLFKGNDVWRWITVVFVLVLLVIPGLGLLYAFQTNTTWKITKTIIEIPASIGILNIDDKDVENYNNAVLEASKKFVQTGILVVDDASGLSYYDSKTNKYTEGALIKAGNNFNYVAIPLAVVSLAVLVLVLWFFTFKRRR